jgi:hypothetical protein
MVGIVIFHGCHGYGMVAFDSGCQWFVMIDVGCYGGFWFIVMVVLAMVVVAMVVVCIG